MAEISAGTLYEVNKSLMKNQPVLSTEEIINKNDLIYDFTERFDDVYFMLLCNEKRDYTLFRIPLEGDIKYVPQDLIECLANRGEIQSIEETENDQALECWIKINDDSFCYYFFPYDKGVIDYGD